MEKIYFSDDFRYQEKTEQERANKTLLAAKRLEKKQKKAGWKYVKINDRLQMLVPCDKNGNPTQRGLEMIRKVEERF